MTKETLEEAAKKYSNIPVNRVIDTEERYFNSNVRDYDAFIEGAEWQAKKMYSEEEVLDLLAKFRRENRGKDFIPFKDIQEWFEQFKKK